MLICEAAWGADSLTWQKTTLPIMMITIFMVLSHCCPSVSQYGVVSYFCVCLNLHLKCMNYADFFVFMGAFGEIRRDRILLNHLPLCESWYFADYEEAWWSYCFPASGRNVFSPLLFNSGSVRGHLSCSLREISVTSVLHLS